MIRVSEGQKKQRCICFSSVNVMIRRWLRVLDVLDGKERAMDVKKGYVKVNDEVGRESQ